MATELEYQDCEVDSPVSDCDFHVEPLPENIRLTQNGAYSHVSSLDNLIDLHFFTVR